jgi:hypothetical protein
VVLVVADGADPLAAGAPRFEPPQPPTPAASTKAAAGPTSLKRTHVITATYL